MTPDQISPEVAAVAEDFSALLDWVLPTISAVGTAGGIIFILLCAADIARRWTLRSDSKWKF